MDAPVNPLAAPPPPPPRPTAIPLPAAFAGDTKTYRDFKTKLNNKFRADAPTFRDEQHRLSVAASLLTGRAADIMRPYILDDRVDLPNVAEFWTVLDRSFEDPDREGTASRALNSLKQGKDEFSVYYAEFSRLKTDVQWNDAACINVLRTNCSQGIRDVLRNRFEPLVTGASHGLAHSGTRSLVLLKAARSNARV